MGNYVLACCLWPLVLMTRLSFHILPNINKLMLLVDGVRMLRVLCVVKSERMWNNSVVLKNVCICAGVCGAI